MTELEFAQQLQSWKEKLLKSLLPSYEAINDEDRRQKLGRFVGRTKSKLMKFLSEQDLISDENLRSETSGKTGDRLAFDEWKKQFTAFLEEHVPKEASSFKNQMGDITLPIKPNENTYENFSQDRERICEFIDRLIASSSNVGITPSRVGPREKRGEGELVPQSSRNQVFISYSHHDRKWLKEIQTIMKPLVMNKSIEVWDDTKIKPGDKWKEDIESALASARVAVLLVSAEFIASDFIVNNELPRLLNAAKDKGVSIFWIYLSACLYEKTEIVNYQAAHTIPPPLDKLNKAARRAVLSEICVKIEKAANE